ncbi:MAG TPA: flippase [Terriglobales bacterium]|nr:flippase [Terriglobales bacterium]
MEIPQKILTPSIAKNTLYNFLFRGSGLFFGFITSIVVARLLGPEKLGEYSLAFWILTIIGYFVNLGLPTTVTKYISEYSGKKDYSSAGSILRNCSRWIFWAGFVITILLLIFSPLIASLYHKPYLSVYLRIGALGMIPMGLLAIYMAGFSGFLRYDLIAFLTFILSPLTFVLLLLALVLKKDVGYLFWVSFISNFLGAFLYYELYHSKRYPYVKEGLSFELKSKLIDYSRSIFVILLLEAFLWERFELLFLGAYGNETQVAFYNLGFNLANKVILLLPGALAGVLLPFMSEAYGGGKEERLRGIHYNSTRYLALIAFPLCAGGIALAPKIITSIYGFQYLPSAFIFSVVLLAGTVGSISTASSSFLYSVEKQKVILRFYILAVILKLVLNFILTRKYQATGAVWVNFAAQVFFGMGIIIYLYAFFLKVKFPMISLLKIALASVCMGFLAYLPSAFIPGVFGLLISILLGVVLYPVILAFSRALEKLDFDLTARYIQKLPFGLERVLRNIIGVLRRISLSEEIR